MLSSRKRNIFTHRSTTTSTTHSKRLSYNTKTLASDTTHAPANHIPILFQRPKGEEVYLSHHISRAATYPKWEPAPVPVTLDLYEISEVSPSKLLTPSGKQMRQKAVRHFCYLPECSSGYDTVYSVRCRPGICHISRVKIRQTLQPSNGSQFRRSE